MIDASIATTAALTQTATPGSEVGPEQLATYWPLVVRFGWFLVGALAVGVIGWLVVQPLLARAVRRRNRNNPTLQEAILLYFRLFVVLVAVLVGITVAGYGQVFGDSALIISAVALAIGIAAQAVIGSLASGVALVADPEFNVGDYIEWDGGEGTVESIALRVTRVETIDGELVTIPNRILTDHEITRPYGRAHHRIVQELGIAYEDDVSGALAHLEDLAAETERILRTPPPAAYLDELGDDEVTIRVTYWIENPDRREVAAVRSAYATAAKQRLEADGFSVGPAAQRDLQGEISIDESTQEP